MTSWNIASLDRYCNSDFGA